MTWKEFLLNALVPTLGQAGEAYLEELLEKLGYVDADHFQNDVQGTYSLFKRLQALAETTKTPIDDVLAEIVVDAVTDVAKAHNFPLPD